MQGTGIKGLDEIIEGLRLGDNVVWRVDDISFYSDFVTPFVRRALEEKKKVVYIRFGSHAPLLDESRDISRYTLDAAKGFESFTREVNHIITEEGKGAYYVFDCLSELAGD